MVKKHIQEAFIEEKFTHHQKKRIIIQKCLVEKQVAHVRTHSHNRIPADLEQNHGDKQIRSTHLQQTTILS